MKRILYLIFVGFLAMSLSYCSGDEGPIGPTGPKGEQGAKGDKGDKGADGTVVLSGTKNPEDSEGIDGDFYINTVSYTIFGPKKSGKWGSASSLLGSKGAKGDKGDKGAKGDKGDKGAKGDKGDKGDKGETEYELLNGSGEPTVSLGDVGDFYVDTKNKVLYFKAGTANVSTWNKVANLASTIQFTKEDVDLSSTNNISIVIDFPYEELKKAAISIYIQRGALVSPLPYDLSANSSGDNRKIVFDGFNSYAPSPSDPVDPDKSRILINVTPFGVTNLGPQYKNLTVRIVITEADVYETVSKTIDFSNYGEVQEYFNLKN